MPTVNIFFSGIFLQNQQKKLRNTGNSTKKWWFKQKKEVMGFLVFRGEKYKGISKSGMYLCQPVVL